MIERSISHLGENRYRAVSVEVLEVELNEPSRAGAISVRLMDANRETLAIDFVTSEGTGPIDERMMRLITMSVLGIAELEADHSTWESLPNGWGARLVGLDPSF